MMKMPGSGLGKLYRKLYYISDTIPEFIVEATIWDVLHHPRGMLRSLSTKKYIHERNHQVKQMTMIYRERSRVIVLLTLQRMMLTRSWPWNQHSRSFVQAVR